MGVAQESRNKRRIIEKGLRDLDAKVWMVPAIANRRHVPVAVIRAPSTTTRKKVRSWMAAWSAEYETATHLVEAANVEFDFPQSWIDDESHWIWEEALNAIPVD